MQPINKFLLEGTHVQIIEEMDPFTRITMLVTTPMIDGITGKPSQDRITLFIPNELIEQFKYKFDSLLSFGVEGFISPIPTGGVHLIASSFRYMGGFINEWR